MKIDPNIQPTPNPQADQVAVAQKSAANAPSAKTATPTAATSEDTLQISSRHAQVQQLTAQLANVPEVRAGRVAPLKQAVQQKTFQPNSGKIADALLAEQFSKTAKA